MFLYIFRVILLFWIISVVVRWIDRFLASGNNREQDRPATRKPADPETTPPMGKIVDAEYEDLDGGA